MRRGRKLAPYCVRCSASKYVGRERRIDATIDAGPVLRVFARNCDLRIVDNWDCPSILRRYLEPGEEAIRAAAISAAISFAYYAALSAADSAADSAHPAYSAAYYEAYSAAYAAVRLEISAELEKIISDEFARQNGEA